MSEDGQWTQALEYAKRIDPISSLFSQCIRAIQNGTRTAQDPARARAIAVEAALPLVRRSPSLTQMLVAGVRQLKPRTAEPVGKSEPSFLLREFSADEMSAIIALGYLIPAVRKRCNAEEWQRIEPRFLEHVDVAHFVGEKISQIGSGVAIAFAGARYLGMGLFASADLKLFKEYRRLLDKMGVVFIPEEEDKRFGCTSAQVGAVLLQRMGYGERVPFGSGLLSPTEVATSESDFDFAAWSLAANCVDKVHAEEAELHDVYWGEDLIASREMLLDLRRNSSKFSGSRFAWIVGNKDASTFTAEPDGDGEEVNEEDTQTE